VPGIPFYFGKLIGVSSSTIGLVSWFIGLDLLLVGMGLWVRSGVARLLALATFALAACFQFFQFVNSGVEGAPASVEVLGVEAVLVYFLLRRFDAQKAAAKQTSELKSA
jgi:uncharacterized membrane protein